MVGAIRLVRLLYSAQPASGALAVRLAPAIVHVGQEGPLGCVDALRFDGTTDSRGRSAHMAS
ncbi:predicted protein [Streptomyces sp. C]|nr:predicted protein [Streptomyces sp. C]